MVNTLDLGPLSWVKGEIELALEQTMGELTAYLAEPAHDEALLKQAYANLHQAHGALAIVGLDGLTEFSLAVEESLVALAAGRVTEPARLVPVVQSCVVELRQYLDDLMAGAAHQPLKLLPLYRALLLQQGLPEPEAHALFFPDLTQRPPRREREPEHLLGDALDARLRAARMGFERGLLKWIKGDAKGISEMKASLTMVELTQTTPAGRSLWWISLGVLDALGVDGFEDAAEAKRFLLRLASHIKKHVEGHRDVAPALLREALYLAAVASHGHAALAVVRAAYRLERLIPVAEAAARRQVEHLNRLRDLIGAAQKNWRDLCGGAMAALPRFHEAVTWFDNAAAATQEAAFVALAHAIREQADLLRRNPMRHTEALGVEMANALHLAFSALDHFDFLGSAFAEQVDGCVKRLFSAAAGEAPVTQEMPPLDAIPQAAAGAALLPAPVAHDIHRQLGLVEQALDRFFRDPTQKTLLANVFAPLQQVRDALLQLNENRAAGVVDECVAAVAEFAQSGPSPQQAAFDQVAQKLLSIGFFVSQLAVGPANPEQFFGAGDQAGDVLEPNALLPNAAIVPADLSAEAADALDADLRAIFLEEAEEILASLAAALPKLHSAADDRDSLVIVRRGFHTLKGSGRMVGLHDLGEVAWVVEQVLNHWLDEALAATPGLLSMLDNATQLFDHWVRQSGLQRLDVQAAKALVRQCEALGAVPVAPTFFSAETEAPAEALSNVLLQPAAPGNPPVGDDLTGRIVEPCAETAGGPGLGAAVETAVEIIRGTAVADAAAFADGMPKAPITERPVGETVEAGEAGQPATPPGEAAGSSAPATPFAPPTAASADVLAFPAPAAVRVGGLDIAPALYNMYLEEAQGYVATLQAQLGQESVPKLAVIRAAHTLASISAATGFAPIHHLAHALENALVRFEQLATPPNDTQRFVFARCAGALEGMLGAVSARRMPGEEAALAATLEAMSPGMAAPSAEEGKASGSRPADVPSAQSLASVPPAAPATAIAPVQAEEPEAIDSQLLSVFMEESADLLRDIGEQLRAWQISPEDDNVTQALARSLHTFKGSARMVGAMACSDVLHGMETRLEEALAAQAVTPAFFNEMENALDQAAGLLEHLRGPSASAAALDANTLDQGRAIPDAMHTEPGSGPLAGAANNAVVVRVRADLIDQWVNEAGEMSIARTRIEGGLREIKGALMELTDSVSRLRNQLREVEIQAESQLQSQAALAADQAAQFDPLEFDRFTRFQEVTRMMAESVNDVATVQHNLLLNLDHANAALMAQARLNRDLSQHLMRARMMPFESLAERLYRVVRQAAKDADKQVVLHIQHGEIEMDRSTLEKMVGSLEHLLRNSIAHGIESAPQRIAAGKPATGQINLALKQEDNDIVISLADDGAGLDFARIRQHAVERGLLSPEVAATADESRLSGLIFHPGFSTAEEVTSLSGRGVGLGVVKNETAALGGRIEVRSQANVGTTFLLAMPQTMAIAQVVLVRAGDRHYAIPSALVAQVNELKPEAIASIREAGQIVWQGETYPWHYLPHLLGEPGATPVAAARTWLMHVNSGSGRMALEVDAMAGNQEIVIKPIGPQLARVPWLLGATVLADGEVVFLINPVVLLASNAERAVAMTYDAADAQPPAPAVVMVVDDSLTVRKVMGRLLDRHGYRVVTAKDGVDALEQLRDTLPDDMPAVMLIDIEMPRMDGFELARHLRSDAQLALMPLIAITSRTADKHRQHAREVGINHYLGKPYNEEELLALVTRYARQNLTATRMNAMAQEMQPAPGSPINSAINLDLNPAFASVVHSENPS